LDDPSNMDQTPNLRVGQTRLHIGVSE
jgi:hypothetical protein